MKCEMQYLNATAFRKDAYALLERTAKGESALNVSTKDGSVVMISEEVYRRGAW